ncbi:MAG: DUF1634 domain-containing protein [Planctomycetota bacterium]|nr:MAG: DUF1634 domain-containing protein [Planctomycetota bacterium]
MSTNRQTDAEQSLEAVLGGLLRWGTLLSATVVLIGGAAFLWVHGAQPPHYATFRGETSHLNSVADIVSGASRLQPEAIIQLGLLLLVATPIARVIGALVAFLWRRDRKYVVISALVLAALLYGLLAS